MARSMQLCVDQVRDSEAAIPDLLDELAETGQIKGALERFPSINCVFSDRLTK
jgi:hypothetical protein